MIKFIPHENSTITNMRDQDLNVYIQKFMYISINSKPSVYGKKKNGNSNLVKAPLFENINTYGDLLYQERKKQLYTHLKENVKSSP
ncbi:hypothetical protein HZS_7767 [Henneguya salminicola]|nr:hypothetical protein HZS_7767 [Henneguya salminicola]